MRNKRKEIAQVLDFQRFSLLRIFYASFTQALRKLAVCYKRWHNKTKPTHKLLDFQRFANIT